jgi:hypothetical protein
MWAAITVSTERTFAKKSSSLDVSHSQVATSRFRGELYLHVQLFPLSVHAISYTGMLGMVDSEFPGGPSDRGCNDVASTRSHPIVFLLH